MVEQEVDIDNIKWPDKCAFCNTQASASVTARCSAVKSVGFYLIVWTTKTQEVSIKYPVCSEHRLKATVASILSRRSMFYLGIGVLTVFALIGAVGWLYSLISTGEVEQLSDGQIAYFFAFPAVYWSLFFWAKNNTPVRIKDTKGAISFVFTNDTFGNEFAMLNRSASAAQNTGSV